MADYKYQMIITWSEEDNAFVVSVPDLPGCMADGKTITEAVENAKIIIAEWIQYAQEDGIRSLSPEPSRLPEGGKGVTI